MDGAQGSKRRAQEASEEHKWKKDRKDSQVQPEEESPPFRADETVDQAEQDMVSTPPEEDISGESQEDSFAETREAVRGELMQYHFERIDAALLANAVIRFRKADTVARQPSGEATPPRTAVRGNPLNGKTPEQIIQSLTKYTSDTPLRSISVLYNQAKQDKALGPFSKEGEAVVPCFFGGDYRPVPDMRFASMDPDVPVGYRTKEATKLPYAENLYFCGVSGGGKTSTIFDFGCRRPLIYVACASHHRYADNRTADALFERLTAELVKQCASPVRCGELDLHSARANAEYLIRADICVRLLFLQRLLQTARIEEKSISAEQILLAQLYDAKRAMLHWFERLAVTTRITMEALQQLTAYVVDALRRELAAQFGDQYDEGIPNIAVAIDEAQAVAHLLQDNNHGTSQEFYFDHATRKERRGLLYAYSTHWNEYAQMVVVAGINMMSDTAAQTLAGVGKQRAPSVPLPYLNEVDVRKRLKRVLDVTDEDLAGVNNLGLITGRCRWVATLVAVLAEKQPWLQDVDCVVTKGNDSAPTAKAIMLEETIAKLASAETIRLCTRVENVLAEEHSDLPAIQLLLQRLHVVNWLCHQQGAGLNQEFSEKKLLNLLGLDLVLQTGPVSVALDPIGAAALDMLSFNAGWDPASFLAERLVVRTRNLDDVQLGYEFELLVAAALVDFKGTIADLMKAANRGNEPDNLPQDHWTRTATLNFKHHTCNTSGELRIADLQSTIFEMGYEAKPTEWLKKSFTEPDCTKAKAAFQGLAPIIRVITCDRELRLHVILPGYAKAQGKRGDPIPDEEGPSFDPNTREAERVFIEGNKVRVIIDSTNYDALFKNNLKPVAEQLLTQKAEEDSD